MYDDDVIECVGIIEPLNECDTKILKQLMSFNLNRDPRFWLSTKYGHRCVENVHHPAGH